MARTAITPQTSPTEEPRPQPRPSPIPAGSRREKSTGKRKRSSLLKMLWMPMVIILVVVLAVFIAYRLHGVFGKTETTRPGMGIHSDPAPFNPKTVVYEVFGVTGAVATINYLDLDAQPQKAVDVTLPWSLTLTTTAPAASPNIVAQGNGDTITCRITVDGVVKDERTYDGVNAQTFCLVKAA
jgi:hypothetical protein